jgi:hypothetical protein
MESLVQYSVRHKIGSAEHDLDAQHRAIQRILKKADLHEFHGVISPEDDTLDLVCFAIEHNKMREGLAMATPERIERLKRVMKQAGPPQWYNLGEET